MSDFLTDGVVSLRAVTRPDLEPLRRWRNDPALRLRTREHRPLTELDQEKWYQAISGADRKDYMFVVWWRDEPLDGGAYVLKPIGAVGLCHWAARDRTAEISFYIGDESARGHGLAERALRLLIDYGWRELNLARIWAEAYAFNAPSIGLLEKLGFRREGCLRQHVYRDGARVDAVILGLLREEWEAAA